MGRTLVSAGELSLSCARLLAGRVTALWLRRPLSVSQHGQLSLPSFRGRLMSSNPCYSGLRRQTAEGVVRGVAYRPRLRVLLAARLECLTAGSRLRNGDERRSLVLWAVREPTSHWGLCLVLLSLRVPMASSMGFCCLSGNREINMMMICSQSRHNSGEIR